MSGATGRAASRLRRVLFGSGRLASTLTDYAELVNRYGSSPTFAATAGTINNSPGPFQELQARGVELAALSDVGTNRRSGPQHDLKERIADSFSTFNRHGISLSGFYGPHLGADDQVSQMLAEAGFAYSSLRTVAWEVMDREQSTPRDLERYHDLLRSSGARDSAAELSLPASAHGVIDLPVTLPNDRVLADMLRQPAGSAGSVWLRILQRVHRLGELMIVTLAPERLQRYREALEMVLSRAREYTPGVWVATMGDVARWWHERQQVTLSLSHLGRNEYRLDATGADRLALLVRQVANAGQSGLLYQAYRATRENSVTFKSPLRPCIGIGSGAPSWQPSLLRELGFVVEEGGDPASYGLYFGTENSFDDPRAMLAAIEGSDATLVRLGLWPDGASCALCIVGEVPSAGLGRLVRRLAGRHSS